MRVPERLMLALDSRTALKTVLKSTASRSLLGNHGTSDYGHFELDRIQEQCMAGQFPANFL
jgi:hypothetical protein